MEGRQAADPSEPYGRFLTSSGHFSVVNDYVKTNALMPPRSGELSVFAFLGATDDEKTALACLVARTSSRKVYGWGEFLASAVYQLDLSIKRDNKPERHANVVGWPEEKDRRQMLASELAEACTLQYRGKPWVFPDGHLNPERPAG